MNRGIARAGVRGQDEQEVAKIMTLLNRASGLAIGVLALAFAGSAGAQENLDQGKTPAQLFASDCAICHKSPQGLAKSGGLFGVESFLREHYTASRESAAAIAGYLAQVDRAAGPAPKKPPVKRAAKGDGKTKTGGKPEAGKPGEMKGPDAKSTEPKSSEPKSSEPKSTEPKTSEPKASEAKPPETKAASEPKAPEPKPAEAAPKADKPAEGAKSENKSEKKSD